MTRQQFTRYYLTLAPPATVRVPRVDGARAGRAGVRLGIGHDLKQIALNPRYRRRLASEADVLALRPELDQTE